MPNKKNTKKDEVISLKVDETTKVQIMKDPKIRKTVQKVFDAIGGLQDTIDERLKEK